MRLILVRHGQTDSNVGHILDTGYPGAPLNSLGLEQAEALVAALAHEEFDAIYSSDLLRARQTATPLANARGLQIAELPGLREIHAGEHDMTTDVPFYVETLQRWWLGEAEACLPGGENAHDFFGRYDAAIGEIASKHEKALLVSHGAALRVWVGHRAGNVAADETEPWRLDNTDVVVLEGDPASGWTLLRWADVVLV